MAAKKRSIFKIQQASTKSMPPMNLRLQRFWNPNSQGSNKRVLVRFWRWPVLLYLQQIPFKALLISLLGVGLHKHYDNGGSEKLSEKLCKIFRRLVAER
ncbi:hypothetical protein CUMW_152510, partial [Citrus unshiu]